MARAMATGRLRQLREPRIPGWGMTCADRLTAAPRLFRVWASYLGLRRNPSLVPPYGVVWCGYRRSRRWLRRARDWNIFCKTRKAEPWTGSANRLRGTASVRLSGIEPA